MWPTHALWPKDGLWNSFSYVVVFPSILSYFFFLICLSAPKWRRNCKSLFCSFSIMFLYHQALCLSLTQKKWYIWFPYMLHRYRILCIIPRWFACNPFEYPCKYAGLLDSNAFVSWNIYLQHNKHWSVAVTSVLGNKWVINQESSLTFPIYVVLLSPRLLYFHFQVPVADFLS